MNNAVRKLPVENADQALISVRAAAELPLRGNGVLSGKIGRNVGSKAGQNISMGVNSADRCRVNNAYKQNAGEHAR